MEKQEVNYISKGKKAEQCKDCKNFKRTKEKSGTCFGHKVSESGHCNFFNKK